MLVIVHHLGGLIIIVPILGYLGQKRIDLMLIGSWLNGKEEKESIKILLD